MTFIQKEAQSLVNLGRVLETGKTVKEYSAIPQFTVFDNYFQGLIL